MKKRLIAGLLAWGMLLSGARAEMPAENLPEDLQPEQIYRLEERLSSLGFFSNIHDDIFDESTRMALESFQMANDLAVTGLPDQATMDLLESGAAMTKQGYLGMFARKYAEMEPMTRGTSTMMVTNVQKKLKELGYFSNECDSVFGEATENAVERFQMANGLNVTGIVDGTTMMRLMEGAPILWQDFLAEMQAKAGDSGLDVYVLQKKLRQMGFFTGDCTGNYGDLTQKAVSDFQQSNGLEITGTADAATWEIIYSGSAVSPRKENIMQIGDYGDTVREIQQRLKALGWFGGEVSGEFTTGTETALRLFQMGSGIPSTGELDESTMAALSAETALRADDESVPAMFNEMLANADAAAFEEIARAANRMLGASFEEMDQELYPGFSFVQYACVAAGLPVMSPEALIHYTDQRVEPGDDVPAGNVVAFQSVSGDSITIMLTISAGEGRIIYATAAGGWVVISYMDQIESSNVYRWGEKVEIGE